MIASNRGWRDRYHDLVGPPLPRPPCLRGWLAAYRQWPDPQLVVAHLFVGGVLLAFIELHQLLIGLVWMVVSVPPLVWFDLRRERARRWKIVNSTSNNDDTPAG